MELKTLKHKFIICLFLIIVFTLHSCLEEIEIKTEIFESILVVEANITNEIKKHEIMLSRTHRLEKNDLIDESGATIFIYDNASNTYHFHETEEGKYVSDIAFKAEPTITYTLSISTTDGGNYVSDTMQLTQNTSIKNLYVERELNQQGIEGVSIFIDTFDPTGSSKYYRYEYEETYKVIAPLYSPSELIPHDIKFPIPEGELQVSDLNAVIDFLVDLELRKEQKQICYNTVKSNNIILANTTNLFEDRLDQFRIRFINRANYIISYRYSILVKQYVQSREANVFYETLNSFSQSENLFSENQSGFLKGNIFSENGSQEKVIGFFEVSSVDSKRLYFNYKDLFQGEALPPYYVSCDIDALLKPALLVEDFAHNIIRSPLLEALNSGYQFFEENDDDSPSPFSFAPFTLVLEPCGDCTVLGSNNIPDFWEEN